MAKKKRRPWLNAVVTLAFLLPVAGAVIYLSFHVSDFECEVCLRFDARSVCATATGKTESEGLRTAIDTACGQLTSGVTETLRCSRTPPTKAVCRRLDGSAGPGGPMSP